MKVIVVGSHGFIGGYLCQKFIQNGWEVVGLDGVNMYKPEQYELFLKHYELRNKRQLPGLSGFYRLDCAQNGAEVARIVRNFKPDVVVNLAGTSVADICKKNTEEAVHSIYQLNANILEALKDYEPVKRYIFSSSSMIYGDFTVESPDEESPKNPKDPYGAIKLGAELLIQSFNRQFNLPYVIIRPSAVYGPLDSNMRVTGIFLTNAHKGKALRINDPNEKLDFTYVEDTAEGFYLAATQEASLNQVFNITRGEGRTILDLARCIQKHYPDVEIIENMGDEHMGGLVRPMRGGLCIDKARNLLGYDPKYSLEEGVDKYVREWKDIYGG